MKMNDCIKNAMIGLSALFVVSFGLTGCNKENVYDSASSTNNSELNEFFDFKTTKDFSVKVDYSISKKIFFEVYGTNPLVINPTTGSITKRSDLKPLFIASTNESGVYTGKMNLPASLSKIYIYSDEWVVSPVLTKDVSSTDISVSSTDVADDASVFDKGTRGATSVPTNANCLFRTLDGTGVTWNASTGTTNTKDYKYGSFTTMSTADLTAAQSAVSAVLAEDKVPNGYLMGEDFKSDLKVNTDGGTVSVTYVYGRSRSHSMLAYYCYEGETPSAAEIAKLPKCIIFANTYDYNSTTVPRGTTANLKYLNADGTFASSWPANSRVGFVLFGSNAFSSSSSSFNISSPYYSSPCSATPVGAIDGTDGGHFSCCSTVSYKYNGQTCTMLGFEDWVGNKSFDYNDVVIQITGVFPTIQVSNKETTVSSSTKGLLSFEDCWPSRSDYDMNDLVMKYEGSANFTKHDIYTEKILSGNVVTTKHLSYYTKLNQVDSFWLTWSGADYNNGFGYEVILDDDADINNITISKNDGTPQKVTAVSEGNHKYIIYLFDKAKNELGITQYSAPQMYSHKDEILSAPVKYTVTIPYDTTKQITTLAYTDKIPYNSFITVKGDKTKEIHMIDCAPTTAGTSCTGLFGTNDDTSKPSAGEYYRSSSFFPFAINLDASSSTNASVYDINLYQETTKIYEVYPKFLEWAKTKNSSIVWWK